MKNSNKGFTLVELSIVLVIIGLLIGGLLVAQSLIGTTKVQSLVRQIAQFDSAVSTFHTKYNQLPGDSSLIDAAVGDNDGLIDSGITTTAPTAATFVGETVNFWKQLTDTGMKREEGAGSYGTSYVVGTDFPKAKIGSASTGVIAFGQVDLDLLDLTSAANAYWLLDCSGMSSTTVACKGAVKGPDAIAIDTKIDDGVGTSGSIAGFNQSTNVATWALIVDGTEAAYAVANENVILGVRMGISTGDLK